MEQQIEFDFMKKAMQLEGKTCGDCKHVDGDEGICDLDGSEVDGENSCGFWEHSDDKGMEEIALDSKKKFHELMDKYKISEQDKQEIFICCHWF